MRLLPATLALAVVTTTAAARANMAAVQRHPARLGAPATTGPNPLHVEHETLSFVCKEVGDAPSCTFEARYTVTNPDRQRHEVAAAFLGVGTRNVVVSIDGRRAQGTPTAAEMRAIVEGARAAQGEEQRRSKADLDQRGFTLAAEPGARLEIVVTGDIAPGRRFIPEGYAMRAVSARHLLAGTRTPERTVFDLEYLVAPIRTWKGDPRITVRITVPSRWKTTLEGKGTRWSRAKQGASTVIQGALFASSAPPVLAVEIETPARVFANGGPLIGFGGTLGRNRGVRGRIGYEVAAPGFMLYSATVDTNFRDRFIVTPMVEAASPTVLFIPSVGLGVGAPIQISPDPRAGVRIQADVHLYALGFVTSVDIYPRFGSALAGFTEVSLLGQVGF